MAKANKEVSPAGLAHYPRLNQPDTKYDANGIYHTKLRMDTDLPEVQKFIAKIDAWAAESLANFKQELLDKGTVKTEAAANKKAKAGDLPYTYETDDDGEDTNIVLVNFKMRNRVPDRKNEGKFFVFTPIILDAQAKILKGGNIPLIYGGSTLKVRFEPILWATQQLGASVQLRMDAVQIIELVTGGSESADGFDAVEGGYEGSDDPVAATVVVADDSDDDDDGDDGDF